MAQVVSNYSAKFISTGYIYASPDIYSSHTQYDVGTPITLPKDYAARMDGEFYPVDAPYGWVLYYEIGNITPNYTTVTDTCTAPTSVTLNTSTKVLTIKGGAGGDLNTFSGYGISWRDRAVGSSTWGSWTSDAVVNSTNTTVTYTVTAPAGYERQFRVRTRGSAGSSYYSAYVTCSTTLLGNTAPGTPTFRLPAGNATSRSQNPVMVLNVPADADGDTLTLKRQIDSGSWVNVKTIKQGAVYDQLSTLAAGSHTVRYKLADAYAEGTATTRTFTVSPVTWGRTIATGTVISNKTVSHVADINELLTVVNAQRAFYGLSAITLPGTVGRFGDWQNQMQQLLTAINASRTAAGQGTVSLTIPTYPTASVFNSLREYAKGL